MLKIHLSVGLFLIIISLLTLPYHSHSFQPFNEAITNYTKFFQVSQQIQLMKNYSINITFNSTRQKYMFIFYPLMGKCVDEIQQEYQAFMQSLQNCGIGAATYGALIGTKIAVKAGLWKFGFASLIKAAALSTISMSALPFVAGVGAVSYLLKNYKQQQVKQICRLAIKQVDNLIVKLQLQQLRQIQSTAYKYLQQQGKNLNYRIKIMTQFPQIYKNFVNNVKKYKAKQIMFFNYFKNFIKITGRN